MDKDNHEIDINPLLAVAGGEFDWFLFMKPKNEERMVTVTNGHCGLHICMHYVQQFKTWHISGTLFFNSPMLPKDPIENTAVVVGALEDIMRTATRLAGDRAVDFGNVMKSSLFVAHFSDAYAMPEDALWSSAGRLMQQEVARCAQVMGHTYDAANEVLFNSRTRCMPQLATLQDYLPRDKALHAQHVDAAASRQLHEKLSIMCFLTQSADELLVKPKERPTLN
jgi:hypothetical protein